MFTGIIEEVGILKSFDGNRIEITCKKVLEDVKIGDSISTNGICLTVVEFGENYFAADVMPETFRKTTLSDRNFNLERALKVGERLGGHIVSGHIDGVGKILSIKTEGNALLIKITAENNLLRQTAPKGSVALDGISLTVADANEENFSVSMIPHTREVTNFKNKRIGSLVNIETDILAKYLERMINFKAKPDISKDFLAENGFI
ncbi:MAG: riboflavin synthase [Selenomonadaceae bacterium]|nr:riboflavin synthase [Selenomonadaceae bacterium]